MKQSGHDAIARQADEHLVTHRVALPKKVVEHPFQQVAKRLSIALFLLVATALIVYADHEGYNDNSDGSVDLLDAFYYATVTLSTTGYGDITPVSDGARLTNILVVTPLRVFFLIVLVGTTLEVLTERTREEWRLNRWSQRFGGCATSLQRVLPNQLLGADRSTVIKRSPALRICASGSE